MNKIIAQGHHTALYLERKPPKAYVYMFFCLFCFVLFCFFIFSSYTTVFLFSTSSQNASSKKS